MKKVAFLCCLFCGLITQAVGATYNCKPQSLGPLAFKSSNEYLFLGESNYDNKIALVCGHKGTDGCEHGTLVHIYGLAYYKSILYDINGVFKCDTSGGSSWDYLELDDFNKCSGQDGEFLGEDDGIGFYGVGAVMAGKYEGVYYTLYDEICFDEVKKTDTTNASETTSEQDTKQKQSGDAGKKSETKSGQGAKQKQPAQTQSGDAEENEEDKWLEPCSQEDLLKVPHAKEGRYIYRTKDEIVCAATKCDEGYYLVRNAEGKSQGWCKYGTDPYATTNASETTSEQGASSSDASGTGATGADATGTATSGTDISGTGTTGTGATGADATGTGTSGAGTSAQNQPGGGTAGQVQPTAPVVKQSPCDLNQSGWLVFEGRCITDTQRQNILAERQAAKVSALTQKIESTASQLDSISSRFKVSVWKDAEGKFNTARLASDSIAGVVLGTAGGLITSHVVKKNQVENGFQDIKCTIGGQSVANWGDEFSVGIQ